MYNLDVYINISILKRMTYSSSPQFPKTFYALANELLSLGCGIPLTV